MGNVEESILGSKINLATSQLKPVLSNKLNPSIVTLIAPDHPTLANINVQLFDNFLEKCHNEVKKPNLSGAIRATKF